MATPILEKLSRKYSGAAIDFLVRKGNESLLEHDPRINDLLIWNKKAGKNRELIRLIRKIRARKYDVVINVQRYASMGLLTLFSGAKLKIGFKKNPFSFGFNKKVDHDLDKNIHEVERNNRLIQDLTDNEVVGPSLCIPESIKGSLVKYRKTDYLTVSPTSVWSTKQLPRDKWIQLINGLDFPGTIYLLGGPEDWEACNQIKNGVTSAEVSNLCGELSLLESAWMIGGAKMNYVNDSAPLHFASSFNAPVTAFFCSTVPSFGFGPLSDNAKVIEIKEHLSCRPCGLHGFKSCPEGHFKCGKDIQIEEVVKLEYPTEKSAKT